MIDVKNPQNPSPQSSLGQGGSILSGPPTASPINPRPVPPSTPQSSPVFTPAPSQTPPGFITQPQRQVPNPPPPPTRPPWPAPPAPASPNRGEPASPRLASTLARGENQAGPQPFQQASSFGAPKEPQTPPPPPRPAQPGPSVGPIPQQQQAQSLPPQTPPPPPPPPTNAPGHAPSFFDVFSFIPFIIGAVVVVILIFVGIKVIPGLISKATTKEVVILSYWGLWEDSNIMRVVLNDFEKEHPTIKVDYKKWDIKQYRETLSARIKEGIGPDIFRFHNSWLPMFRDNLTPIPQDVISSTDLTQLFPKVVRDDLLDKGAIYGIPLEIDTLALFVNTSIFNAAGAKPPQTWEDLQKVATTLTVKDELNKIKTAGVALGTFDNINHASDIISLMVLQNHGVVGGDTKSPAAKNAQDAICFYISFAKNTNAECTRASAYVWDDTQDMALLAFAKSSSAMYLGYSWDIFIIKTINPNLPFQVVKAPQLPNQNLNLASYWVEGVSKKGKHQKEALELLKFLSKKETVQKLYTEEVKARPFGEPFARLDLAETLKDNQLLSVFAEQAKTAVSTPFSADTFDNGLNQELNNYLGDMIRKALGNTSISSAFETLSQGVSATQQKYGIQKTP